MTKDEAIKLALEALEKDPAPLNAINNAKCFLYSALEQPEQEPVAWYGIDDYGKKYLSWDKHDLHEDGFDRTVPLYIAPPKREWVGLTDEEILNTADFFGSFQYGDAQGHKRLEFARAIEQRLKEKNHD